MASNGRPLEKEKQERRRRRGVLAKGKFFHS
jgi:hypothetical protein